MGVEDTPSIQRLREQMLGMQRLTDVARLVPIPGIDSEQVVSTRRRLDELQNQIDQMTSYFNRFNDHLAQEGWLAHASLKFEVLKSAVDAFEAEGAAAAHAVMMDYYSPESLKDRLFFLNWSEELRVRRRLVNLAFDDYCAGRYHAVVPVLLMMMDGAVNDAVGKGFHAATIDLDCWDSITAADGAIENVKRIFQRSRKKTRTEEIDAPYRHGILHGVDLGYDTAVVAAKCWCFMFVVSDWIVAKTSEEERRTKFDDEGRTPSWRELGEKLANNKRVKQQLEAWRPRDIDTSYLESLGEGEAPESTEPEVVAIELLRLWSRGNFGGMSKLHWRVAHPGTGQHAGDLRSLMGEVCFDAFRITSIVDEAAAITQVTAVLSSEGRDLGTCTIRLTYETEAGEVAVRGLPGAAWKVVWARLDSPSGSG